MRISFSRMCATLVLVGSTPCFAQTMNYGALEDMFGEPVTTSATGSPQKAADAPVNMEIITADDIRRSGADNVPDVLRFVAGVDVRRYGKADADVGIRGYNTPNSARVLVLVNGRQIYIDYHSYTAWQTLPVQLDEIRQIEVIKGPNTALFGFNAVAGVINIVTFDPVFDNVNQLTTRIGNKSNQQLSAVTTAHLGDKTGLRLSVGEHGGSEANTDGLNGNANGLAGFGPYPEHFYNKQVSAHGRTSVNGIDLTAEMDAGFAKQLEMTVGAYPGRTYYHYNSEKIGAGSKTDLGYLNLNAYRNEVVFEYPSGFNCAACTSLRSELYVLQASDLFKAGVDHTIRLGAEYRNNRAASSIFGDGHLGLDLYAANAMWNWQVTPKVQLTNSVRMDYVTFKYNGTVDPTIRYTSSQYNSDPVAEPSFNSAVVYQATNLDAFRVSVARGVQIPDFYALFPEPADPGFQPGTVLAFEGTPNLKPTVIMNYEVDYDRQLPAIDSKAQVALFHQTSRDVIGSAGDAGVTDPATGYGYAGNIGRSNVTGMELSLKGANADGWRWKSAYAFAMVQDSLNVNPDRANPNSTIDFQHGTPTHSVILGLGKSWEQWEADVFGRWQSHFDDAAIVGSGGNYVVSRSRINDYTTLDARIGYTPIERLTLAVSGQQMLRTRQIEVNGPPVERKLLGTATLRF